MKISVTKTNGSVVEIDSEDNEYTRVNWIIGDFDYDIVYDNDGDLFGIENSKDAEMQKAINEWVQAPYDYDFPPTFENYKES